jgi:hypothetical protein
VEEEGHKGGSVGAEGLDVREAVKDLDEEVSKFLLKKMR